MKDRVSKIQVSQLRKEIEHTLKSYQKTNNEKPTDVTDLYIVGSYITDDFRESESDIDIFICTNKPVTKNTEKFFYEYFNNCDKQKEFQTYIPINIEKVDCTGIGKWTKINESYGGQYIKIT